jgi:hypothetical protein
MKSNIWTFVKNLASHDLVWKLFKIITFHALILYIENTPNIGL